MVEMLDIFDDNLSKIGTMSRAEVHRRGHWHRVFHCWVIARDADGVDWVVMQKRAANKETFPNRLDVAAAGHYQSGESIEDGLREVREELGIMPEFSSLIPVGRRVTAARFSDLIDREVADVFFLKYSASLADYQPDPAEVAGLVAFRISDGLALHAKERDMIEARAFGLGSDTLQIRLSDFIPHVDGYVYRALTVAQQILNAEKYITI